MNNTFIYNPVLGEHHPIYSLIKSMTVELSGVPSTVFSDEVSVVISEILVKDSYIQYTVMISADIFNLKAKLSDTSGIINIKQDKSTSEVIYTERNGVVIRIATSGITVPEGRYAVDLNLRLSHVKLYPAGLLAIHDNAPSANVMLCDGYNVSVTRDGNNILINGGAGLGIGKYSAGSVDKLYCGIRSINGLNLLGNIDIYVSDLVNEHGGRVDAPKKMD